MIERLRRFFFGEPVDELPTLTEREALLNTRIGNDLTESQILSISPMGAPHSRHGSEKQGEA